MQSYLNHDEINITDLINVFRRNLMLIIFSVLAGLFVALLISGTTFIMNRRINIYSLSTSISLTGDDVSEQTMTIISNAISHGSIVTPAKTKLNIDSLEYRVFTRKNGSAGILHLIVEGPDSTRLTSLSNEVFNTSKPLIEAAFPKLELRKLEIGNPIFNTQSTRSNIKWMLNSILGIMLGGMLSVFYIFTVYFMSPNIVQDNELESLFNAKVLGKFVSKNKKQTFRKHFEVR